MPVNGYEGLGFSFAGMSNEVTSMASLAKSFLEESSLYNVLPMWNRALINFKDEPYSGRRIRWEISERDPIKTKTTSEYEAGARRGGRTVFGQISCVWEISKPVPKGKKERKRSFRSPTFVVIGLACTKVTIWGVEDAGAPKELARWTLEIGDAMSPGCHFHTQINLDARHEIFPKSLPVPRLPSLLHTPMDALDFLLGELFQNSWFKYASQDTDAGKTWAHCQTTRLTNLLKWQSETIKNASAAPWATLKKQKPSFDLLIGN